MPDERARSFLQLIRRSQRGRLKIYLGYGPGVGKTYQMLSEAHRLKAEGIDVVVGLVETHGRVETARLVEGLDVLPRRRVEYHGITVEEMDVDAVLARKPQVVLVDELAHTNVPGGRNDKRYEDVQEILAAGIHVITTLNVQHLESLYNTIENLIGVKVRERLPDSVLAEADVVVNVDLAAEDLQKRLQEGKVYPSERIAPALANFFTSSNLEHLRELTLRELASQIDQKRREVLAPQEKVAPDQVMVCLSSRGPNGARLLRFASRLAGRLNRNWYAVYVQTPSEDPTVIDLVTQRMLGETLTLANQLGATVFTFKGQDVADTILRFAQEYRVGQIVYNGPSMDGSRPGIFYVNTYDLKSRPRFGMETLFLHEAEPGHHFQIALQRELTGIPTFRRFSGQTAFNEGWGLYAESLGKELGMYGDPTMYFGNLEGELWRSIRLVTDTGLHTQGWTRQQVLDYMFANSSVEQTTAIAEAERFMAIPGQALAYKMGQRKIRELRTRAEQALGGRFDVRAFHTEVLKDGSLPLGILEAKIDRWIEAQKAASS